LQTTQRKQRWPAQTERDTESFCEIFDEAVYICHGWLLLLLLLLPPPPPPPPLLLLLLLLRMGATVG
jgi:hypothetical protein